jgi:hypothetical protein
MSDQNNGLLVEEAVVNGQELVRLERRRNKILIWSIVTALFINVGWMGAAVWRDRTRAVTIENLAKSINGLRHENQSLSNQLRERNEKGDRIVADAFGLLNGIRSALDQTAKVAVDNNKLLLQIEAELARTLGRSATIPSTARVQSPSIPPPLIIPNMSSTPTTTVPQVTRDVEPNSCLISLLGVNLICS